MTRSPDGTTAGDPTPWTDEQEAAAEVVREREGQVDDLTTQDIATYGEALMTAVRVAVADLFPHLSVPVEVTSDPTWSNASLPDDDVTWAVLAKARSESPLPSSGIAGVVCWYSLMYLPPDHRPLAFAELARVVRQVGYLVTAFKAGDNGLRRGGRTLDLGIGFDVYWMAPDEMSRLAADAGFTPVFWAGRPADEFEGQPQGYLLMRRT